MKHCILHLSDLTTNFLKPIYQNIPDVDVTVITGGLSKEEIIRQIEKNDHILLLGHGHSSGLMNVNCCPGAGAFIVDSSMVPILKSKLQLTTIWCYAKMFVEANGLERTTYVDMFCSEILECNMMGFNASQEQVDESNWCFSKNLGEHILKTPEEIYTAMQNGAYAKMAETNPVASYNFKRLGYRL
jgi:hypothetical protein